MSLRDKLQSLKADEDASRLTLEARRDNWINSVGQLYVRLMHWFEDLEEEGLVRFARTENEASEESIGPYNIEQLTMDFGRRRVVLQPVGTNIIGSDGRIDMFPQGYRDQRVMLLLFRSDTEPKDRWEIWPDTSSKNARPLTKETVEELIERWLA